MTAGIPVLKTSAQNLAGVGGRAVSGAPAACDYDARVVPELA